MPAPPNPPDSDDFLDTAASRSELARRSIGGGLHSLGGQGLILVLRTVTTVVLARLLLPADFGLVAMAAVVTGVASVLWDMGLGAATVQSEDLRVEQVSTLFWLHVAIGAGLSVTVALLAPVVAWYFGEPQLVWITRAQAGAMLLAGLGLQHQAVLRRQLRFGAIAAVSIGAIAVASAVAIACAVAGLGLWSLVILRLVEQAATSAGLWWRCSFRPGWPRWSAGMRPLLTFGGSLTATRILFYAVRNLDRLLIGRALGAEILGYYTQAYQLLLLPIRQVNIPVSRVALSTLSRLQAEPERFRRFYRQGLLLVSMVTAPVVVFLAVAAPLVIEVVLGAHWAPSAPIFRVLAPAALVAALSPATNWLWISTGRTFPQLRWMVLQSAATCIGFVLCLPWGSTGVAAALSVTMLLIQPWELRACLRESPATLGDVARSCGLATLAAAIAGATSLLVAVPLAPGPPFAQLVLAGATFGVVYLALLGLLPGAGERLAFLRSLPRRAR